METLLPILVLCPLIFAALIVLRPPEHAKEIALVGTFAQCVVTVVALLRFDWSRAADFQLTSRASWLPAIGLEMSLGVDSVALLLIALTALLGPICVLCSYTAITERVRSYYGWLLVLQTAMAGVFASRDLLLFYICFEFTLVPMYVLIRVYGSSNRQKAATKFFLYTFTGSLIALAGLVYVVWWNHAHYSGEWSLDIGLLGEAARHMPAANQALVMAAMLAGFAVKVPLFPLHTWLPLAHTEAPTAGSVILAGVLLKLGTYGLFRFVVPFAPLAVAEYAPAIAMVSIVGILYGGLVCWVQSDMKRLVAYSSVAHLGFCVLGLVALNQAGLAGSVLYMLNHGLSTGALFLLVGMMYERHHTRSMREIGGLAARMPVWSTFMVFFVLASVGLPGLNGFVSELLCLMGTFQADSAWGDLPGATPGRLGIWYAAAAGAGMIVAAMYLLIMVGRVVFGPLVLPHGDHGESHADTLPADLTRREIGVLVPLAALCLLLGVYPRPLLQAIERPVDDTVRLVEAATAAEAMRLGDAAREGGAP